MEAAIALWRVANCGMTLPAIPGLWRVPPYVIGGLASFWLLERLAAF